MTSTTITVRVRSVGFHRWPDAPDEVRFLASPHRHVFGFAVTLAVTGHDRELEFFLVQARMRDAISSIGTASPMGLDFGAQSCEHIACALCQALLSQDLPVVSVEVDEDGENSACVRTL